MACRNHRSATSTHRPTAFAAMCCLGLLAFGLVPFVHAAPGEESNGQLQDENVYDITFQCSSERSSIILSDQPPNPLRGYETQIVDLGALITYEKDDLRDEVRRTGAKSISSECGALTVVIQGAYFNANPQGELGATEDYAVVTIRQGARVLIGPIALGSCSKGNPRYDIHAKCPGQWATRVAMHAGRDGVYSVALERAYDEWLTVTP
ncbi:hypothetical protein [Pseudoxanthomonas sp. PXM01]|uniref:hypothetical protein n=1 Tax=Pseudoxanthomonas sp. PXM01 TaxID=2769295 RepID=UPI00177C05F7|nr:hypothetical protein [Pseudoxanthomonas sp. PXM01]MBD9468124.1 hypothetical protein [Pseudoxanthomonas sp. PXM01]